MFFLDLSGVAYQGIYVSSQISSQRSGFIVNSLILIFDEPYLLADSSIVLLGPKKTVEEKNRRVSLVCFGLCRLM